MIMEKTKRCPYCGEEILAVAKKCKHCGEWLEEKKQEMEKKACPICGELVDADKEICPQCNERTHFMDDGSYINTPHQHTVINNGSFLYCKTCKEKISANANTCLKCGDDDPFYFKDIMKTRKRTNIGCSAMFSIAFLMTLIFQCAGSKNGLLSWSRGEGIIFFIVLFLFFFISKGYSFFNTKEHQKDMDKIFIEKNDSQAHSIWNNKLDEQK